MFNRCNYIEDYSSTEGSDMEANVSGGPWPKEIWRSIRLKFPVFLIISSTRYNELSKRVSQWQTTVAELEWSNSDRSI